MLRFSRATTVKGSGVPLISPGETLEFFKLAMHEWVRELSQSCRGHLIFGVKSGVLFPQRVCEAAVAKADLAKEVTLLADLLPKPRVNAYASTPVEVRSGRP